VLVSAVRRRLTLGTRSFTIPTTGRVRVRVRLSRRNFGILTRRRSIRTRATVTISGLRRTVVFTLRAPPRRR
jgi:hypothetical protein